jgi:uncharacterized protein YgiM (DUF1202 family)
MCIDTCIVRAAVFAAVSLLPVLLLAQEATPNRNSILRRDPSTASPKLAVLPKGSRVTLVDATTDSGFYHVRTEDDQVGWVFAKLLTVSTTPDAASTVSLATGAGTDGCDTTLWKHVYHPSRLIVKQACVTVTGTIVDATAGQRSDGVRHEADGDTHGWLKLDPEFKDMLDAGNTSAEGGNMVFEIICRFPVTQKDAQSACKGYSDHTQLPAVGTRVRVVGTYVQDTFHAKWNEIHPVSSISVLP